MASPRPKAAKATPVELPAGPSSNCWAAGLISQETPDPLLALQDKDLTVRTAACRDLAKIGLPPAIPVLADLARSDRSPAVRLGAAAAVSDILSRYRLGPARAGISDAERSKLLHQLSTVDPGHNSGMFMMLACLDTPEAARRIRLGLKDPRGEVRVGAGVGLLRLCCSAARGADVVLEAELVSMIGDPKLRPDAIVELARVAAAAGYRSALPALERLDLGGASQESINAMIQVLKGFDQPADGAWLADGMDAGELNPAPPRGAALLVVGGGEAVMLRREGGWLPLPGFGQRAARRMHFRRPGAAQAGPALQVGEHTFYPVAGEALAGALLDLLPALRLDPDVEGAWASVGAAMAGRLLGPLLPESGPGLLGLGRLLHEAGEIDAARAVLLRSTEAKKPPVEAFALLGQLWLDAGEAEQARAAWSVVAEKGKKKDPLTLAVRARLDAGIAGGA